MQRFALGVFCLRSCNETLNTRIGVPSDYAQTNNCPPTLSASYRGQLQGCIIDVTFAPTSTGPKRGTLSTGPGGPTATLTGNGVTTPTPPALPLQVFLTAGRNDVVLEKKLELIAITTEDSKLVAKGRKIKKTTKQLAANEPTVIKVELKNPGRLNERARTCAGPYARPSSASASGAPPQRCRKAHAKIEAKASDEFGQAATDAFKFWFFHNPAL